MISKKIYLAFFLEYLASLASSRISILGSYIVFLTKLQKRQILQNGFALLKIADMQSRPRCQTYSRFLRWLIFAPYDRIPEYLSGWKEIIQDVVLTE
jgi:hypothetical protein